ncbi:MAG: hypothetical protein Fur0037_05240 [Planctomycetota bacterium]
MALILSAALQTLLSLELGGNGAVRLGVPLPAEVASMGLSARPEGSALLQWRPLQRHPPDRAGRRWFEIVLIGPRGRVLVSLGGRRAESALVRGEDRAEEDGDRIRRAWVRYATGEEDRVERRVFGRPVEIDGERYEAGEALTDESEGISARSTALASIPAAFWRRAGLLSAPRRGLAALRARLAKAALSLPELRSGRGEGDFARGDGEVANLEYDTVLAFVRQFLRTRDPTMLERARRSARHLVDRDLDPRSGLPFPHGPDHRSGRPAPGHCWLRGLLLLGCLTADDEWIGAARGLALSLAAHPPSAQGRDERARDFGWPLGEMEAFLSFEDQPAVSEAADRLAAAIAGRYDGRIETFRFGEGEVEPGIYLERGWVTASVILPAVRAHLCRRPDSPLREMADRVEARLVHLWTRGGRGAPTHWRIGAGRVLGVHRELSSSVPAMMLDGLSARAIGRILGRTDLAGMLGGLCDPANPDLATDFTRIARCEWIGG